MLICTPPTDFFALSKTLRLTRFRDSSIGRLRSGSGILHCRQSAPSASGGRYNPPNTFPVLYCANSQMIALLEVQALFATADGQLHGAPRDPDLVLSLHCELARVLDLTSRQFLKRLERPVKSSSASRPPASS